MMPPVTPPTDARRPSLPASFLFRDAHVDRSATSSVPPAKNSLATTPPPIVPTSHVSPTSTLASSPHSSSSTGGFRISTSSVGGQSSSVATTDDYPRFHIPDFGYSNGGGVPTSLSATPPTPTTKVEIVGGPLDLAPNDPVETLDSNTQQPNVYINGLPPHFPEEQLRALAEPYGPVHSVRALTRYVGERVSGYGFVLFCHMSSAHKAIEGLKRYRNLHPSLSKQQHKINSGSVASTASRTGESFRQRMERLQDTHSANLYVEGLPTTIDAPGLAALVHPHHIISSRFFLTKLSTPTRVIAFVRLESREAAQDTISRLNGRIIRAHDGDASRVAVRFADSEGQRELRRAERLSREEERLLQTKNYAGIPSTGFGGGGYPQHHDELQLLFDRMRLRDQPPLGADPYRGYYDHLANPQHLASFPSSPIRPEFNASAILQSPFNSSFPTSTQTSGFSPPSNGFSPFTPPMRGRELTGSGYGRDMGMLPPTPPTPIYALPPSTTASYPQYANQYSQRLGMGTGLGLQSADGVGSGLNQGGMTYGTDARYVPTAAQRMNELDVARARELLAMHAREMTV